MKSALNKISKQTGLSVEEMVEALGMSEEMLQYISKKSYCVRQDSGFFEMLAIAPIKMRCLNSLKVEGMASEFNVNPRAMYRISAKQVLQGAQAITIACNGQAPLSDIIELNEPLPMKAPGKKKRIQRPDSFTPQILFGFIPGISLIKDLIISECGYAISPKPKSFENITMAPQSIALDYFVSGFGGDVLVIPESSTSNHHQLEFVMTLAQLPIVAVCSRHRISQIPKFLSGEISAKFAVTISSGLESKLLAAGVPASKIRASPYRYRDDLLEAIEDNEIDVALFYKMEMQELSDDCFDFDIETLSHSDPVGFSYYNVYVRNGEKALASHFREKLCLFHKAEKKFIKRANALLKGAAILYQCRDDKC